MNNQSKKIGILDGMGAFAGARFFQQVLEKISLNQLEFPEIILDAVALEDFVSDSSKISPALVTLSQRVKNFNHQDVSLTVMACNTAHILHPHLSALSSSHFPSLIDLVSAQVAASGITRVGILASPLTIKTKLYENSLTALNLTPHLPSVRFQRLLEDIIRQVLTNSVNRGTVSRFQAETSKFIASHQLEGIILGCTELPLVFPTAEFSHILIFDSLDILSDAVIDHLIN